MSSHTTKCRNEKPQRAGSYSIHIAGRSPKINFLRCRFVFQYTTTFSNCYLALSFHLIVIKRNVFCACVRGFPTFGETSLSFCFFSATSASHWRLCVPKIVRPNFLHNLNCSSTIACPHSCEQNLKMCMSFNIKIGKSKQNIVEVKKSWIKPTVFRGWG